MSINGALANALSGLVASSRAAEVVSANISNALTDGYGRRELQLSAMSVAGTGAGVKVDGILRVTDIGLVTDRRASDAGHGYADAVWSFYDQAERAVGLPEDEGSLNGTLDQLEASLVEATSRPDSQPRLLSTLRAAQGVASQINSISDSVQKIRESADRKLQSDVEALNRALSQIADLNSDVRLQYGAGRDASALVDQRQQVIDSISDMVPIMELPRDHGEVALLTTGGAILVDGKAAEFSFASVGVIAPDMTIESGALGKLTMNGEVIDTTLPQHAMRGGTIGALFAVRDELSVTMQSSLDGVARDLIERFESASVDPTLNPGDAGLFTDNGNPLNVADEVGLAGRLTVNAAVDPDRGGAIWRLRAGINAVSPGSAGDSTLLTNLTEALQVQRIPPSGGFMAATRSASGLASDMLSRIGAEREAADNQLGYTVIKKNTLITLELQSGVDSDHELQELLIIEQAYAANARVVKAIDTMIDRLLEL